MMLNTLVPAQVGPSETIVRAINASKTLVLSRDANVTNSEGPPESCNRNPATR